MNRWLCTGGTNTSLRIMVTEYKSTMEQRKGVTLIFHAKCGLQGTEKGGGRDRS